jgi:hypothetical protein
MEQWEFRDLLRTSVCECDLKVTTTDITNYADSGASFSMMFKMIGYYEYPKELEGFAALLGDGGAAEVLDRSCVMIWIACAEHMIGKSRSCNLFINVHSYERVA